jgi:hypothetical protein
MLPARIDLSAYHGDTWSQTFKLYEAGQPADLTGATAACHLKPRTGATIPITATVTAPTTGEVTITLPATPPPPARYEYDLEVTKAGVVTTWAFGHLNLRSDVTNAA